MKFKDIRNWTSGYLGGICEAEPPHDKVETGLYGSPLNFDGAAASKRHVEPKTAQKKLTVKLKPDEEAFCGESTNRPKERIFYIDAADAGNELAAVEYVEDIYKFYKLLD
ncbi:hypothetical protein L6164_002821 [Bauhinia variegata]|uniref:Uncharacterized protein n=1 Tax=Bauhinia variegata TaxID=167791 RepID=A0ACB9PZC5_BAUVA|nr:hypothetical protein L6164_002821 [Bauhinia variegata]